MFRELPLKWVAVKLGPERRNVKSSRKEIPGGENNSVRLWVRQGLASREQKKASRSGTYWEWQGGGLRGRQSPLSWGKTLGFKCGWICGSTCTIFRIMVWIIAWGELPEAQQVPGTDTGLAQALLKCLGLSEFAESLAGLPGRVRSPVLCHHRILWALVQCPLLLPAGHGDQRRNFIHLVPAKNIWKL